MWQYAGGSRAALPGGREEIENWPDLALVWAEEYRIPKISWAGR